MLEQYLYTLYAKYNFNNMPIFHSYISEKEKREVYYWVVTLLGIPVVQRQDDGTYLVDPGWLRVCMRNLPLKG